MKKLGLVSLISFTLVQFSHGQEEFKEELEESLGDMIEQLEERKSLRDELEENLQSFLNEKVSEDEFEENMLRAEIEETEDWIERNTVSIGELSRIIDSTDLDPEQKESKFATGMERLHRSNHLHELEFESHRLELELELHAKEGEEKMADHLEKKLDNLNLRIDRTEKIHAEWEKVAAAREAEQYEKAEELRHVLWIRERDLELSILLEETNSEVAEIKGHAANLRKERERVENTLTLSVEMQKQTQKRLEKWTKLKGKLKVSSMEESYELIEEFERSEEKSHLVNEVLNMRKHLLFAESEGNLDEIEELQSEIEELEQEIKDFQ